MRGISDQPAPLPAKLPRQPLLENDLRAPGDLLDPRGELRPFLLDTLSKDTVTATGLFHWPALKNLINAHLERKVNVGYHLWGLLVLFMWMKKWKIEAVPAGQAVPRPVLDEVGWSSSPLASSSS